MGMKEMMMIRGNAAFHIFDHHKYHFTMSNTPSFNAYLARQVALLRATGKVRTSETYQTALNRFNEFSAGREVAFSEIGVSLIGDLEEYLLSRRLCRNTTSFYMRILRAVYNRGVKIPVE